MLPSIDEFKAEAKACRRRAGRIVLFVVFGVLVVLVISAVVIPNNRERRPGQEWIAFVPAAVVLIVVPGMLYGFWRADQYYKNYPRLRCPYCGESLVNLHHTVIASQNCPHCGRQVLRRVEGGA